MLLVHERRGSCVVADRDRPALADDQQHRRPAGRGRRPASRRSDGMPQPGDQQADREADDDAGGQRGEDAPAATASRAWSCVTPRIAAHVPAVKPADRSISPSSRTKTRPIARTMIAGALVDQVGEVERGRERSRLAGRRTRSTSTTRPRTAGSEPTSPPRIAVPVVARRRRRCRSGRAAVLGCGLRGAVGLGARHARSSSAATRATLSESPASRRCRPPLRPVVISSTTWVLVDVLGAHLRGHPPEVQAGDAVGHLEDVVHVVRDEHARRGRCRRAGAPG